MQTNKRELNYHMKTALKIAICICTVIFFILGCYYLYVSVQFPEFATAVEWTRDLFNGLSSNDGWFLLIYPFMALVGFGMPFICLLVMGGSVALFIWALTTKRLKETY